MTEAADRISIVGGGGHASDVLNVIHRSGLLDRVAGYLDDVAEQQRMRRWGLRRLGPITGGRLEAGRFVLGIGLPRVKSALLAVLEPGDATALTVVDPDAMLGFGCTLGPGTVVFPAACVSALATLGAHVLVGHGGVVGHDTIVGDRSSVMPAAAVSGDCRIGAGVLIGTNATVLQGVTIGDGVTVGAGAVVTGDVPAAVTVVGSPARPVRPAGPPAIHR